MSGKGMSRKVILVVAAHGDDEVLGCGGVMARHAEVGDAVHVLLLADGETARDAGDTKTRQKAAQAAGKVLGVQSVTCLDLPDNRMDSLPLLDIVKKVEQAVEKIKPQIIYTHHGGDLNIDHQIMHRAVLTACRPLPASTVREIYGFEVLSSTEWASTDQDSTAFRPVRFVAINCYFERKLEALRCYETEMRDFPHARSYGAVEALAKLRGAQNGLAAAEGFTVLRQIVP
jgi:N-acetylglucosamine malate deacetylase 1